jgi:hypothetical protein
LKFLESRGPLRRGLAADFKALVQLGDGFELFGMLSSAQRFRIVSPALMDTPPGVLYINIYLYVLSGHGDSVGIFPISGLLLRLSDFSFFRT